MNTKLLTHQEMYTRLKSYFSPTEVHCIEIEVHCIEWPKIDRKQMSVFEKQSS